MEGISLTHGSPRKHIWTSTFAASADEVGTHLPSNCPCTNINQARSATTPPAFAGSDYFCDTASQGIFRNGFFYGGDPLWDGAGCGPLNTCSLRWKYPQLLQHSWGTITSVIQQAKAACYQIIIMMKILSGMELVVGF